MVERLEETISIEEFREATERGTPPPEFLEARDMCAG
jgi:hypothetical protein